ncbi:hypothetical protein [Profundibacter sp.]
MEQRLKKLNALTKMALDVEMMKLQQIALAEQEKTDLINKLHVSEAIRTAVLTDNGGSDLALYGGADKRWAIWKQKRVSDLNTQKAALIAARDEQKLCTQKAFGKDEAVRRLVATAREAARLKQSRL